MLGPRRLAHRVRMMALAVHALWLSRKITRLLHEYAASLDA
jgi:hypothetical protein